MRTCLLLMLAVLFLTPLARADEPTAQDFELAVRRATLGQFWGAVLVAKDGQVLFSKGFGDADQTGRPITDRSVFDIGSITKCFTAAAILKLEEQGKLSLDDPITRFYPDVPAEKQRVTLHHLLTHTSGLAREAPGALDAGDDRDAMVGAYLQAPLRTRPGDRHEYSNPGYFILAAVIEKASGESWESFLTREILDPAAMASSACCADPPDSRLAPDLLTVRMDRSWHVNGTASSWPYPYTWGYRGAGGVVSSAHDMHLWDRALRADAPLAAAARDKMFTPALDGYALGWRIDTGPLGRVASHTGSVRGFVSAFSRWLDRDACIVVLTNELHNPVLLTRALSDVLFPEAAEHVSLLARADLLKVDENKVASASKCHTWIEPGDPHGARLLVAPKQGDEPAVTIQLSPGAAEIFLPKLQAALDGVAKRGAKEDAQGANLEIFTAPYSLPPKTPLQRDGAGVSLEAKTGTMHPEPGGGFRVLLYIKDDPHSMLPVFLKIERGTALRLLDELRRALNK